MQEFRIHTLVDVTNTNQIRREGDKALEYQQQQNYMMLLQAASMRVNLNNVSLTKDTKSTLFGKKNTVWTFKFFVEYEGGLTDKTGDPTGLLKEDLHFVPITTNLTESATINPPFFDTKSGSPNTKIEVV